MNNWNECLLNGFVKKVSPDDKRAESLIKTAEKRISLIRETNEENCNFVFEDYYTSLIELIQASAFKRGFNILNHLCTGHYIKEILKRDDLYETFDSLRYKRNSLTYYGKEMEFDVAKQAIQNCKKIIKELQ